MSWPYAKMTPGLSASGNALRISSKFGGRPMMIIRFLFRFQFRRDRAHKVTGAPVVAQAGVTFPASNKRWFLYHPSSPATVGPRSGQKSRRGAFAHLGLRANYRPLHLADPRGR